MWKKYPENRELIFGYASVLGVVITAFYTAYSAYKTALSFDFAATVIALCVLNFFLVISSTAVLRRYFYLQQNYNPIVAENENYKAAQKTIAKVLHNINHQARILINKLYSDILKQDYSKSRERELSFEKYLLYLLDNVKEVFDVLTNDQCAVCIKLLVPDESNPELTYVKTHYRDSISYRERRKIDGQMEKYPYYENTAFKRIIRKENPATFYHCNDLEREIGYNNANPAWKESYNASLVLPISYPVNADNPNMIIIGFLCVDNFKGGFDEIITRNILAAIADINFLPYRAFDDYKNCMKKHNTK